MVIELSGVQLFWNHTTDQMSTQRDHKYDFRPKLHVTKFNYHFISHFQITEFSQYEYFYW